MSPLDVLGVFTSRGAYSATFPRGLPLAVVVASQNPSNWLYGCAGAMSKLQPTLEKQPKPGPLDRQSVDHRARRIMALTQET